ncbi:MAG: pseudouridine synthase [Xanthomonadales bacterium]|nr:pseudouridine synthase [Xanthomonadales bacterium]
MPLILLNKPFRVLSQFTDPDGRPTLADFVDVPGVYPAGRLDFDSEGLILLTDDGRLQARISQPRSKITKTYLVQVEGTPSGEQLAELKSGVRLKDGMARATRAREIERPESLWPRDPPVRERKSVPDAWLEIGLREGRNRQVRRMTAAVGLPTLRLIRWQIGPWSLEVLRPGESRRVSNDDAWRALKTKGPFSGSEK